MWSVIRGVLSVVTVAAVMVVLMLVEACLLLRKYRYTHTSRGTMMANTPARIERLTTTYIHTLVPHAMSSVIPSFQSMLESGSVGSMVKKAV